MRRLLHVALLLMIILGIRACGGMAVTEDRLGAATRAMADKVGLANKKDAFDAAVRPPMAAATQSLGNSISVTTARTVDAIRDGSCCPQPAAAIAGFARRRLLHGDCVRLALRVASVRRPPTPEAPPPSPG